MTSIECLIAAGFTVFLIGCIGMIISGKNLVKFVVSVEVVMLSATYMFALSAYITQTKSGTIFALLMIPVAATELAICLFVMNQRKEK